MRWIFFAVILSCYQLGCALPAPSAGQQVRDVPFYARGSQEEPRRRILVLPFLDEKPDRSGKVAEEARFTLVQALMKTGQLVIVRNQDFLRI